MVSRDLFQQFWDAHRGTLVALVVLLVLNLVLIATLNSYLLPRVAEEEDHFVKRQIEVRNILRKQGGQVKTPEHQFVIAQQDLGEFWEVVPDYESFTDLISELERLSKSAQLELTQVSYKAESITQNSLLRFDLNFNLTGEYEQLKKFIHSLEQSRRLITIREVSLRSAEQGVVSLRLKMETYFHPEEGAGAS